MNIAFNLLHGLYRYFFKNIPYLHILENCQICNNIIDTQ